MLEQAECALDNEHSRIVLIAESNEVAYGAFDVRSTFASPRQRSTDFSVRKLTSRTGERVFASKAQHIGVGYSLWERSRLSVLGRDSTHVEYKLKIIILLSRGHGSLSGLDTQEFDQNNHVPL